MASNQMMKSDVSQRTLTDTPARALEFLMGVASSPGLFNVLAVRGYSADEQSKGWKLLTDCGTLTFGNADGDGKTPASMALAELDNVDEQVFRLVRATLENGFGDAAALVLHDISSSQGPAVVFNMSQLLQRLDELDASKKELDKKAMAKLAARGIDKTERQRLATLVEEAKSLPSVKSLDAKKEAEFAERQLENLRHLRAWYGEWSEVARACVERRDYLIRLGLASRRKSEGADKSPEGDTQTHEVMPVTS